MRIGLNLLHAGPEIGGGWNYIANLVAALGEYDKDNAYLAFVTQDSQSLVPAKPNFTSVIINVRSASRIRRVMYENTWLQLLVRKHELDCVHWFANTHALINAAPGVVTVYDMHSFLDFAHSSFTKRVYSKSMMHQTCRKARLLLPISHATAEEIHRFFGVNYDRLVVIPPIMNSLSSPCNYEETLQFRLRYNLPEKFWLYVAHLLRYKNHSVLLQAYHGLKSSGLAPWPLVLRGDAKKGNSKVELTKVIRELNLEDDVILLPRLRQAELPFLYSAATGLIFPSLYEGAGMPVIEAMACGCPVVASRLPSVIEFAGAAASYFDPKDTLSIANAMIAFQIDSAGREAKRRIGMLRAEEFRAQAVVRKLIDAYEMASMG